VNGVTCGGEGRGVSLQYTMLGEGFTKVLSRGYLRDVTVTGEVFAKIL
jgi:hypothetical protein